MYKRLAMLALASLILSACAHAERSGYGDSRAEHSGYRGMLGDFCPPAQAMKGYC
jgi:hypothetical protein